MNLNCCMGEEEHKHLKFNAFSKEGRNSRWIWTCQNSGSISGSRLAHDNMVYILLGPKIRLVLNLTRADKWNIKNFFLQVDSPPWQILCQSIHCSGWYRKHSGTMSCRKGTFGSDLNKQFKGGREKVKDEKCSRHPSSSINEQHVKNVKESVFVQRRLTVRGFVDVVGISKGSANTILKYILGLNRAKSRLVSKQFPFRYISFHNYRVRLT